MLKSRLNPVPARFPLLLWRAQGQQHKPLNFSVLQCVHIVFSSFLFTTFALLLCFHPIVVVTETVGVVLLC